MAYSSVSVDDRLDQNCDTRYSLYCPELPSFQYEQPETIDSLAVEPQDTLPRYLVTSEETDFDYVKEQTYTILGLSVSTVALMTLLPESFTNWDSEDRSFSNLGKKWKDNVKAGPVWDKDDHVLNYIAHPYFGGVYYTVARHAGYNEFQSFGYSFIMSTFFWEYGVESFAEVPSIQDIIVTPFWGAVVGEWMYQTELDIVANGGEVLGSEWLGSTSLFFLNPVGHIHWWVTDIWRDNSVSLTYNPWFDNQEFAEQAYKMGVEEYDEFVGLKFSFRF
ncbi:DUF3943 domain-containing protein [Vibrio stylophorae]